MELKFYVDLQPFIVRRFSGRIYRKSWNDIRAVSPTPKLPAHHKQRQEANNFVRRHLNMQIPFIEDANRLLHLICLFLILFFSQQVALAQSQRDSDPNASELAAENLSHVSAPARVLEVILRKAPGFMVELKRWVAKEATNQGQMVTDSDLTDLAIFDRLNSDVKFRSVATRLVQRYGYLVPSVDPESALGKEQELLTQERAKWLVQSSEAARQKAATEQDRQRCDSEGGAECSGVGESSRRGINQAHTSGSGRVPEGSSDFNVPDTQRGVSLFDLPTPPREPLNPPDRRSGDLYRTTAQGADTREPPSTSFPVPSDRGGLRSGSQPLDLDRTGSSAYGTDVAMASRTDADDRARNANSFPQGPGSSPSNRDGNEVPENSLDRAFRSNRDAKFNRNDLSRRSIPYSDIPSLYDMYLQASPRSSEPRRFGADVFENGLRDRQLIPMDLPVGPDYVVGPGDSLVIDLWGGVSQRLQLAVSRDGRITLPEVGPVLVSGKTLGDVQQSVQQVLRTQLQNVSASVSLGRLRSIRVYIVGDVGKPGAYDLSSLSTPLNALFMAGGPTPAGSLRVLKHFRGKELVQEVDVYDLLLHGVRSNLKPLENGDTVLVPPLGPEVTVEGMVRRPAVYELHGEKNLEDIFDLAGGMLPTAALGHIEVQRLVAHDKRTMVSLNVSDAQNPSSLVKQLQGVEVKDGDRVRLFPIASFNQDAVYLEGHVLRPGRYSYRKGMRLTDLISAYTDLLPEPAGQYAEIIRLNAPDYRPSVESFSLNSALASPDAAPMLQPLDTVRIFSRFDFENPPTVAVWGEVRSPGVYRASGQIHVSDALHLAGGLSPDAGTENAQVFRYLADGNLRIFSVDLKQALAGDAAENIVLQSRDWMLIHKSPSRVDPASVNIRGEVAKPGRYLLTTNMHVGDLIRMAGGLKRGADTRSAELTRYLSEDQSKVADERQQILLGAPLVGNSSQNVSLRNGDLLTIKELPGWQDIGASVSIRGEVVNPGTYGIHDGDKLSSVLLRAGGFRAGGFPYGAILQRAEVREMEEKERTDMIQRVRGMQTELKLAPKVDAQQDLAKEAAYQQWQNTLENLANTPATGRVTIRISKDFRHWQNTAADLELRAGDVLIVPKKPDIVTVGGQVYHPTAVTYRPGKSAGWYLAQGGGPTNLANKKAIFVVRADGTVVGSAGAFGLWVGSSSSTVLQPGDSVFVPEKVLGGPRNWANLFQAAQLVTSIGSTIFFATRL